ncbi:MAG: type II toxin-antitoxin system HipA family toxin [Limimaricola soesokkakensis]|uniref:type II toxin-antitoxin system HipA family toxin n=1 Tax=Limimaricola soesokkakensis TaxID=1343159 RepID=UPI0040583672
MTTSRIHALSEAASAFVLTWLPGEIRPVPAGRLHGGTESRHDFGYLPDYLDRPNAIALGPDLPLVQGMRALPGPGPAGTLRDALPGTWGRRVTRALQLDRPGADVGANAVGDIAYGLLAGTDGIGALSFQASATSFETRIAPKAELEALAEAVDRVERGQSLSPGLAAPLVHAVAIGGAGPKALVEIDGRPCIAKFGMSHEPYDALRDEYIGLRLARLCHIDVPHVALRRLGERQVLLIERFDREKSGARRAMVSGLTLLDLGEAPVHAAGFGDFVDVALGLARVRDATRRELFRRMAFNLLLGKGIGHARNQLLFWSAQGVDLAPAFGFGLQASIPKAASHAGATCEPDWRARMALALDAAPRFGLEPETADPLVGYLGEGIRQHYAVAASGVDAARSRPAA